MKLAHREAYRALQTEAWQISEDHGWHDPKVHPGEKVERDSTFGELLMLIVSELSEALEAYRDGDTGRKVLYNEDGKPDGVLVELADAQIRLWDLAEVIKREAGGNVVAAVQIKTRFNKKRPYRHGGKAL